MASKPWRQSTGPRSPEGKRRSSKNRYRGAVRQARREVRREMRLLMVAVLHLSVTVETGEGTSEHHNARTGQSPANRQFGPRGDLRAMAGLVDPQTALEIVMALPPLVGAGAR